MTQGSRGRMKVSPVTGVVWRWAGGVTQTRLFIQKALLRKAFWAYLAFFRLSRNQIVC